MRFIKDLLTAIGITLFVLVPFTVLGVIITLPMLAYANAKGMTKLPFLNSYLGNAMDGLDGSGKFQAKYAHLPRILRQYLWLAIRNPTENLKRFRLGLAWDLETVVTTAKVSSSTFPGDIEKVSGSVYNEVFTVTEKIVKRYFEYYVISKPYTLFGTEYCFRARIGWKIGDVKKRHAGEVKAFEFAVNPFCKWGGSLV